ncbi:uncharacterized protein LOC104582311 [Brachypodium distachyon]|uniref:F-box domain-containing protein n=1 Tax=Brachypodium distachyon TaxID=15368 RepID=A0A2K2DS01_BRADI|nr:uncharacterized protein LOC104582311 [Brachypodium distachyon]PNT77054.1 hypothetical protein BRADI_1g57155v3 [Brachypodium distachyon]|eukprot:XP_010230069.1 uncharacterized protein LOC104582311 [Brachypodium distachyon]
MSSQPVLLEELVEDIFLRLPPEEPKHLVRASSICKPWRRILADRGFRCRYREFHRTPPVLGFLQDIQGLRYDFSRFIPTSSFRPAQPPSPRGWYVLDAHHGRGLFFTSSSNCDAGDFGLSVWDPTTDKQHCLPMPFSLED